VQAADDVKLGNGFAVAGSSSLEGLFERHGVCAWRILLAAESAQAAGGDADVCGIDVAIYVEIRLIAVQALADVIGQPSDCEDVSSPVQRKRVLLFVDRRETRVVSLKWMKSSHFLNHTAPMTGVAKQVIA
jgi:hypothetical protein